MNKEKITAKLSSRKFWAMAASVVVSVLALFNCPQSVTVEVTSLITSFGAVTAYILGEASIDKARLGKEDKDESAK